eukprot:Polyplicarium_translucidae@DN5271_c0_g1_i1.p1
MKCCCHFDNIPLVNTFVKLQSEAKSKGNVRQSRAYAKIVHSIRKYPLPIATPQQASLLEGVGKFCASIIERALRDSAANSAEERTEAIEQYRQRSLKDAATFAASLGYDQSDGGSSSKRGLTPDVSNSLQENKRLRTASNRAPLQGSGVWTILVVLLLFSHEYPGNAMCRAAMSRGLETLSSRCKCTVANFRPLKLMLERGWVSVTEQSGSGVDKKAADREEY